MTTSAVQTPRGPVTRKDVARYAGVSTAVVSYVVNGGPKNVAPATEAKVRDAIRILGYRPNAAARALKLGSRSPDAVKRTAVKRGGFPDVPAPTILPSDWRASAMSRAPPNQRSI